MLPLMDNNSYMSSFEREKFIKAADPLAGMGSDTPLARFFFPRSVAIVGATERSGAVGRSCLSNLMTDGYVGRLYPINPKRPAVLGVPAYKSVKECPEVPDLVMIITPDRTVPPIVGDCVDIGVPSIIVISAGFREIGPEGVELENQILGHLRRGNMKTRVLGPNCVGMMNPHIGLNATFAQQICQEGEIALISQSGAMLTSILDWALLHDVGFSYQISVGSMLDLSWGDLLDYLGQDENTKSIVIYMETVGDARSFLSAAREVSLLKPIIVLKAGKTDAAAAAAVSHTGSLAGSDAVLDMAFRRAGVVRVDTIADMFELPKCLTKQPIPLGPRLMIASSAGGPGVLATDSIVKLGGEVAVLSPEIIEEMSKFLPSNWSHANPIDMIGSADHITYSKTLEVSLRADCDGILVIGCPVAHLSMTQLAQVIKGLNAREKRKPILVCYQGGEEVEPGKKMLERAGVPCYTFADEACKMFSYMWNYRKNILSLYERPTVHQSEEELNALVAKKNVGQLIETATKAGRTVMTESESKNVLKHYGIPVVQTEIATTKEEAVAKADEMGYPVVIKIHSETITHKSDVGGVMLNVQDADAVISAYTNIKKNVELAGKDVEKDFLGVTVQPMLSRDAIELLVGSKSDVQFGPVIVFGTGGFYVEVFKDSSLGLPPLSADLAKQMITSTKIYKALCGYRGKGAVDIEKLGEILVRFSRLIVENRRIKELDVNPLLADDQRIIAVDARVVLHDADVKDEDIVPVAIRPYPIEYVKTIVTKTGQKFLLRPVKPEDEERVVEFHKNLSVQTVVSYFKKHVSLDERTSHERLIKMLHTDYDRVMTVGAFNEAGQFVGVYRLVRDKANPQHGKFNMLIQDSYQSSGLGSNLLDECLRVAKIEGYKTLDTELIEKEVSLPLPTVQRGQRMLERFDFEIGQTENGVRKAVLDL